MSPSIPSSAPAAIVAAFDPDQAVEPIAGASVLERQLRTLLAAGVTYTLLLVDRVTPAMATIVGAARGGRMRIEPVRTLGEAVAPLAGRARVLLLADGCLPDPRLVGQMIVAPIPSLATIPDGEGLDLYERIDASTRWAGLAMLDLVRIADTAAMLGDWDPVSTVLRRAVQEGAQRVPAAAPPLLASDRAAMADAERRLLLDARRGRRGWARRRIEGPVSDRLVPLLLERGIARGPVGTVAAGLSLAGGAMALFGWHWPALASLLLSGPAMACANQLYTLHGDRSAARALQRHARLAGIGMALAGLAIGLTRQDGQWGWLVVAAATAALLGALDATNRLAQRLGVAPDLPWLATPGAMPWAIAPFALLGWWGAGAGALLLYALVSLAAAAHGLGGAIDQRLSTGT